MPLRPLTPMSPARIEWETKVTHHVCELAEVSNGDAQAILEADPDGVDALFDRNTDPLEAAKDILDITCTPGPTGPTDEERAAATALLDQPWKLPGNPPSSGYATMDRAGLIAELEQVKRANVGALASLGEAREERDLMRALATALLDHMRAIAGYSDAPHVDPAKSLAFIQETARASIAAAKVGGL